MSDKASSVWWGWVDGVVVAAACDVRDDKPDLTTDSSASLRNDNKNKQRQEQLQVQPQIPFGDDNKRTSYGSDNCNSKNNCNSNCSDNHRSPSGMTTKKQATARTTAKTLEEDRIDSTAMKTEG
jgi:hypothetical protein